MNKLGPEVPKNKPQEGASGKLEKLRMNVKKMSPDFLRERVTAVNGIHQEYAQEASAIAKVNPVAKKLLPQSYRRAAA